MARKSKKCPECGLDHKGVIRCEDVVLSIERFGEHDVAVTPGNVQYVAALRMTRQNAGFDVLPDVYVRGILFDGNKLDVRIRHFERYGNCIFKVDWIIPDEVWELMSARLGYMRPSKAPPPPIPPIRMLLNCPKCFVPHIDLGEWATRVHTAHRCAACEHTWAPAKVPTVGVSSL